MDKSTNPQGIRNQSATYPANPWKVPKRILNKYNSNPWDCPHSFGAAGLRDLSPALIAATCRKRSCPVCGAYWRRKIYNRYGCHLSNHGGPFYTGAVPDCNWPAVRKGMRREAERLGIPLRYVAIRSKEGDLLNLIASVPYLPAVAHPVELAEALDVLERAIDDADFGPRPVSACRQWGPLEREKEVERVPGGCSPAAFKATVQAWGAKVSPKQEDRRIIRPDRAGMFAGESGQLDEQAQGDFWYETWLRDTEGNAAADDFHRRAVEQRKRIKAALPVDAPRCESCSPAERITEVAPDGRQRQVCGKCGRLYGYLR